MSQGVHIEYLHVIFIFNRIALNMNFQPMFKDNLLNYLWNTWPLRLHRCSLEFQWKYKMRLGKQLCITIRALLLLIFKISIPWIPKRNWHCSKIKTWIKALTLKIFIILLWQINSFLVIQSLSKDHTRESVFHMVYNLTEISLHD